MGRVKYLPVRYHEKFNMSQYPNFHASGSIKGMKEKYYGNDKYYCLVKCGSYIYKLPPNSKIYHEYAY